MTRDGSPEPPRFIVWCEHPGGGLWPPLVVLSQAAASHEIKQRGALTYGLFTPPADVV